MKGVVADGEMYSNRQKQTDAQIGVSLFTSSFEMPQGLLCEIFPINTDISSCENRGGPAIWACFSMVQCDVVGRSGVGRWRLHQHVTEI